jgi:hypothetical protein
VTLIAYACKGDHAEIMTDTLSYGPNLRHMGTTTKYAVYPHLDCVLLGAGAGVITAAVKGFLFMAAEHEITNFDEALDVVPDHLRQLWADYEDVERPHGPTTIHLVGYSEKAGEFVAYEFSSDADFAPVRHEGVYLHPAPFTVRPSDRELARVALNFPDDPDTDEFFDTWRSRPPAQVPSSLPEWVDLILECREQRAACSLPAARTLVAGSLHALRIDQGSHTGSLVLEFDDTGAVWEQIIAGTLHPDSQRAPCHCGSGDRLIDCCLVPVMDEPCPCGDAATLRECCAVSA